MEIITSLSRLDANSWRDFINSHPDGNAFQTYEIVDIFIHTPNYQPMVIASFNGQKEMTGILVGVIQKEYRGLAGYFTSRTIVWGGPLVDQSVQDDENIAKRLIKALIKKVRYLSIYIEVRNLFENKYPDVFTNLGFKYIPYINSLLPLKDKTLENILSSMSYNRRREINLSITENAIYKEANSKEEIEDFYEILSDLYKNKVKIPLPTIQFFLQLYESKIGKIFVVKDKEKIIGGAACLLFDQKVLYTLYYCGLKDHHPRIFPSHLAILASIEYGIKYGFEYIDLMGAGRSDKTYGVRDYKKRFGCELPEYGRFLRINNLVVYGLGKMWIRGRKFVPLFNCYIL